MRVARRARLRPRRRGPHRARRAPGAARPAGHAARRAAASTVRTAPFARARRRGRPAHAARRLLARELGDRRRARPTGSPRWASTCPVLLDGAQGVGAMPVDVAALGCAFYAGSGQKWLCGPGRHRDAVGRARRGASAWRRVGRDVHEPRRAGARAATPAPQPDARRHDAPGAARPRRRPPRSPPTTCSPPHGWDARARARARRSPRELAERLARAGRTRGAARRRRRSSRGRTPTRSRARERLAAARRRSSATCPGRRYVRASVGAWNDEDDLDRLMRGLR